MIKNNKKALPNSIVCVCVFSVMCVLYNRLRSLSTGIAEHLSQQKTSGDLVIRWVLIVHNDSKLINADFLYLKAFYWKRRNTPNPSDKWKVNSNERSSYYSLRDWQIPVWTSFEKQKTSINWRLLMMFKNVELKQGRN